MAKGSTPSTGKAPRGRGPRVRGCVTCKARKIKCDETRPTCNRCTKSGRVCDGFQNEDDFIFRHETARLKRKLTQTKDGAKEDTEGENIGKGTALSIKDRHEPSLRLNPRFNEEFDGICLLVSRHLEFWRSPDGKLSGIAFCLPQLAEKGQGKTCLSKAVLAASLGALANEQSNPGLALKAQKEYIEALKMTNAELQKPHRDNEIDILGAVKMMRWHEDINLPEADSRRAKNSHLRHIAGGCALISYWEHKKERDDPLISGILLSFFFHGLTASLFVRKELFPVLKRYSKVISKEYPSLIFYEEMSRVPELLQRFDLAIQNDTESPEAQAELTSILLKTADFDAKFVEYQKQRPTEYNPLTMEIPPEFDHARYTGGGKHPSPFRSKYQQFGTLCSFDAPICLHMSHLQLCKLQLDCFALLKPETKESLSFDPTAHCKVTIQNIVAFTSECIAFALGYRPKQQPEADTGKVLPSGSQVLEMVPPYNLESRFSGLYGWILRKALLTTTTHGGQYVDEELLTWLHGWLDWLKFNRKNQAFSFADGIVV